MLQKLINFYKKKFTSANICTALFCRLNDSTNTCTAFPDGAVEGSICDSGKICLNKECTPSALAPVDSCPFGDDVMLEDLVWTTFPTRTVSCENAFDLMTNVGKESVAYYCNMISEFNSRCCQSCKSMFLFIKNKIFFLFFQILQTE